MKSKKILGVQLYVPTTDVYDKAAKNVSKAQNRGLNRTEKISRAKKYTILIIEENSALGNYLSNILNNDYRVLFQNSPLNSLNVISNKKMNLAEPNEDNDFPFEQWGFRMYVIL